jgi:hypothetical protein
MKRIHGYDKIKKKPEIYAGITERRFNAYTITFPKIYRFNKGNRE